MEKEGEWRAAGLAPLAEASSRLGLFREQKKKKKKKRGERCGTGAYAANGGMLILELDDGAVGHGGRSGVRPGLWMVLRC